MVIYSPDEPAYEYLYCCEYLSELRDRAEALAGTEAREGNAGTERPIP